MKSDAMLSPLGIALRTLRDEAGMSGRDVDKVNGWVLGRALKYERGEEGRIPRDEILVLWAEACGHPERAPELIRLAAVARDERSHLDSRQSANRVMKQNQENRGIKLEIRNPGHCWLCPGPALHRGYCEKHYRQALRGVSEGETRSVRTAGYRRADGTFVHEYYQRRHVRSKPDLVAMSHWK